MLEDVSRQVFSAAQAFLQEDAELIMTASFSLASGLSEGHHDLRSRLLDSAPMSSGDGMPRLPGPVSYEDFLVSVTLHESTDPRPSRAELYFDLPLARQSSLSPSCSTTSLASYPHLSSRPGLLFGRSSFTTNPRHSTAAISLRCKGPSPSPSTRPTAAAPRARFQTSSVAGPGARARVSTSRTGILPSRWPRTKVLPSTTRPRSLRTTG